MPIIKSINISLEIWGSILLLIILLCIKLSGAKKDAPRRYLMGLFACNSVLLLSDAVAWIFKGRLDAFSKDIVPIANFSVYILGYVLLAIFTAYLVAYIETKRPVSKKPVYGVWILCTMAIISVIISQFNHMYYTIDAANIYHRQELFWFSQVGGIVCMIVDVLLLFHHRAYLSKKERIAISSYILLPVLAMIAQIFFYGIALLNLATTVALVLIYLIIQEEQAKLWKEKELELAEGRINIMLSQIQPHFLYNALNTIKYLCLTDPNKAATAVEKFSCYLRGNMDSLTQKRLVSLEQELEHLEHYLTIERLRFPYLDIRYQLQAKEFCLPTLTIQPIVENAIRYGVTKNEEENGVVIITTWQDAFSWYVKIEDNGVGFDEKEEKQDGRSHVGISNTRKRLESMCQGALLVESEIGKGTCVTISIPK